MRHLVLGAGLTKGAVGRSHCNGGSGRDHAASSWALPLLLNSGKDVATARTVVGISLARLGCHLWSGFRRWGHACHSWARGKASPQRGRWLGSHRLVWAATCGWGFDGGDTPAIVGLVGRRRHNEDGGWDLTASSGLPPAVGVSMVGTRLP